MRQEALGKDAYMLNQGDQLLTAAEAVAFLDLRVATIWKLTYRRQLPVVRPNGRRAVRYRRSHLEKVLRDAA